jgi:hypothetical protein
MIELKMPMTNSFDADARASESPTHGRGVRRRTIEICAGSHMRSSMLDVGIYFCKFAEMTSVKR